MAGRTGSSLSLDQTFQRLANASPMEYVLLAGGLVLILLLIMKLLDAA